MSCVVIFSLITNPNNGPHLQVFFVIANVFLDPSLLGPGVGLPLEPVLLDPGGDVLDPGGYGGGGTTAVTAAVGGGVEEETYDLLDYDLFNCTKVCGVKILKPFVHPVTLAAWSSIARSFTIKLAIFQCHVSSFYKFIV